MVGRILCTRFFFLFIFLFCSCLSVSAQERFTDNKDGTVTDQQLALMWSTTDNLGDITWHQAEKWIKYTFPLTLPVQYENWRLPTLDELKTLYIKDKAYKGYEADCGQRLRNTPLITLSCGFVWSANRQGVAAKVFNFKRGTFTSSRLVQKRGYRAIAVRHLVE